MAEAPDQRAEKLIRAAEMTARTPDLREMLLWELRNRGIYVSRYADCGEMAETLQLDLRSQPGRMETEHRA